MGFFGCLEMILSVTFSAMLIFWSLNTAGFCLSWLSDLSSGFFRIRFIGYVLFCI